MNIRKIAVYGTAVLAAGFAIACSGVGKENEPGTVTTGVSVPVADVPTSTAPAQPVEPVVVNGRGSSVVPLGVELNGSFVVAYETQANALIVDFLRSDGSSGVGAFEGINVLDFDRYVSGSTVVNLDRVVMVQTSNIDGSWTLTFTPLG